MFMLKILRTLETELLLLWPHMNHFLLHLAGVTPTPTLAAFFVEPHRSDTYVVSSNIHQLKVPGSGS